MNVNLSRFELIHCRHGCLRLQIVFIVIILFLYSCNHPLLAGTAGRCRNGNDISINADTIHTSDSNVSVSGYEQRKMRFARGWSNLIPKYAKVQYAGGMGLLSIGTGWEYGGNRQWETDILFGFIPKHSSRKARATFTLKQNFTPWRLALGGNFAVEPLSTGIYFNTVFGGEFWMKNPERYPKGYYWFSTRMRIHVFIGPRMRYTIPEQKRLFCSAITLFCELSSCDTYIIQAVKNSYITPADYLRMSVGLKFSFD